MPSLFLGLSAANLLLMISVFALGLTATGGSHNSTLYLYHLGLGVASALLCLVAHMTVFTYFMATCKWLQAAVDKANLNPTTYLHPAVRRKRLAIPLSLGAMVATMITVFAGAGADPTLTQLWPLAVHLGLAITAITVNAAAAIVEFRLITEQGKLIDAALAILNANPGITVEPI